MLPVEMVQELPMEKCRIQVPDLDVLLQARDGIQRAGRELVERHGRSMVRTAWRVLGRYGDADADDVVQEAFVAALTTAALPTGDVGAWLRSITARKALDSLRRIGRRAEEPLPPGEGETAKDDPGLEVMILRQGLGRLSANDRAVLTLVDLEGLSMAEAAKTLGTTTVALKWRAVRARRRLAAILRNEPGG
jgi:RNA polymerase sigma-70 factor (ECF subfamily)